ncbi:unnamed protein product [Caretta caretta]
MRIRGRVLSPSLINRSLIVGLWKSANENGKVWRQALKRVGEATEESGAVVDIQDKKCCPLCSSESYGLKRQLGMKSFNPFPFKDQPTPYSQKQLLSWMPQF